MISHRPLSHLHSFLFFFLLWLDDFHCPVFEFTDFFFSLDTLWCWKPVLNFSVHLFDFYNSEFCLVLRFSASFLKFSLSLYIVLLTSLSIFMAINLNFYQVYHHFFIKLCFYSFSCFVWNILLYFFIFLYSLCWFCALDKTATPPSLDRVVFCRTWIISISLLRAPYCFLNVCNCPCCLLCSLWLQIVEGLPKPVSVLKGRIAVST